MNRLLRHLLAAALLATAACSEAADPTPEPKSAFTFALSDTKLTLEPGATASVDILVTPADAEVDPSKFALVKDDDGTEPDFVRLRDVAVQGAGYRMTVQDRGSGRSFEERLRVEYTAAEGIAPAALTVRNAEPRIPVVYVTTSVPQSSITKDDWVAGSVSIDGGDLFDDLPEAAAQIKGRGNSTWSWDKKPYALKFEKKQSVLGMPKHKRWCLIANHMDRTHLRNRVAYHLGLNSRLDYTTRNEFAEVYFNGDYQGLYLLTEQIKVDENRVNITEAEAGGDTGYLIEMDTNYDEEKRFRSAYTDIPVNIKFPDPEELADSQFETIRRCVDRIDGIIAGKLSGDPFELLNRESMVDYWIIFEAMANREPLHPKSVYFHKDCDGKLTAGPVWDFDWGTLTEASKTAWANFALPAGDGSNWYEKNWWNRLLDDRAFRAAVKERWQAWYPFLRSVPDFIAGQQRKIAEAEARNRRRWPEITGTGWPNGDEALSFDQAATRLRNVFSERIEWMNRQITQW